MLELPNDLLERYEDALDPARPEAGPIRAKVLGYGEISTVLGFDEPGYRDFAFKRMAIFNTPDEAAAYEDIYVEYATALESLGMRIPEWGMNRVSSSWGPVLYLTQRLVPPDSVGHKLIHVLSEDESLALIEKVLHETARPYRHNAEMFEQGEHDGTEIAVDAQISNWALPEPGDRPLFFDTSTPMMRVSGADRIDAELFLRSCPASLTWVVRRFFLQDVLDRYFSIRLVLVDLLSNLIKERRASLMPPALDLANGLLSEMRAEPGIGEAHRSSGEPVYDLRPIEKKTVISYYRQDMPIWWLFQALRRTERFAQLRVLRRPYRSILPGRNKRIHVFGDKG